MSRHECDAPRVVERCVRCGREATIYLFSPPLPYCSRCGAGIANAAEGNPLAKFWRWLTGGTR